ncbi:MAG: hypothetical protein ACHQHN_05905 [Sphingobacteriales bacterium]
MITVSKFFPERQFHVLINFKDDERSVAVLPNDAGNFLVVDQGIVLGQLDYDKQLNCVAAKCELDSTILSQLKRAIRNHFS